MSETITLDDLAAMMGMGEPQITQYELCDALIEMGLSRSRGQSKRLCIQGAIKVNGKVERDFHRLVSSRDQIKSNAQSAF